MNVGEPLLLSLRVVGLALPVLVVAGVGLALLLVRLPARVGALVETVIILPLVLPPSVVGYYLLLALGQGSPIHEWLGFDLLFSWPAAALAATVVGLPLVVQAARGAIASVDPALEQAARTLGASEAGVLGRVTLPLARRGIAAGVLLGTARALGEFGATLMIAGNIPGRTQTMPLAIYDAVQTGRSDVAGVLVLLLTALGVLALLAVRRLEAPAHDRGQARGRAR